MDNSQVQRLIVPGLGVVIFVSAFILGVPLIYKVLLALLGLAAAGTYFSPPRVQVEMRIAAAALGLLILLINAPAFWLTLLSFGAIAALQVPHRHMLQRSSATVEWFNALVKRRPVRAEATGQGEGPPEGEMAPTEGQPSGKMGLDTSQLPGFLRVNVAGIGSAIMGVLVLVSLFIPWFVFLVTYDEEWESRSFSLRAASETLQNDVPVTVFFILIVVALLSIASIVLPRVVVALVAVAGFLVTSFSWLYVFGEQLFAKHFLGEFPPPGVGAMTLPYAGALLATFCFFVMFVLQLVPRWNRTNRE